MALSNTDLAGVPFQRVWSRMTAAEAKAALVAYGHISSATSVSSDLRPDGVLTELEYNNGQGTLTTSSGRRKYNGGLFLSGTPRAYVVRDALEASFIADRSAFLAVVGTDARGVQLSTSEPQSNTTGGASSTVAPAWSSLGATYSNLKTVHYPFYSNSGASLTQPDPATAYTALAALPAGSRGMKIGGGSIFNIAYTPKYNGSAWRGALYEGDQQSTPAIPGFDTTTQQSDISSLVGDFATFINGIKTEADNDNTFLDFIILDMERYQSWYLIVNELFPGDKQALGGSTVVANTGGFIGTGGISTVYPTEWDAFKASLPGLQASDWSAINSWSAFFDERIYLVDNKLSTKYIASANALAGLVKLIFPFCKIYFYNEVQPSADSIYSSSHTIIRIGQTAPYGAYAGSSSVTPNFAMGGYPHPRWDWRTEASTLYTGDQGWGALTYSVRRLRSISAATTKEKSVFINYKRMGSYIANTMTWGTTNGLYEESVLHALLMGFKPLYYNDNNSNASDNEIVNNLFTEYDAVVGYQGGTPEIFGPLEWNPDYIASMQDVGGNCVWRVTPRVNDAPQVFSSSDGVLFVFNGGSSQLNIPRGRIHIPGNEYATAGYWVIQPASVSNSTPVSVGGTFTRGTYRRQT